MTVYLTQSQCGGMATNFVYARGETVARVATVSIDLTGYNIKMQIGFPTPLLLTLANGGITSLSASVFQINISDTTTRTLPLGGYPYDLYIVSPNNTALRLLFGEFTIKTAQTPIP